MSPIPAAAGFHTGSKIADPMFVDPAAGDYRLKPGSPSRRSRSAGSAPPP
jgi:hypothetical protein